MYLLENVAIYSFVSNNMPVFRMNLTVCVYIYHVTTKYFIDDIYRHKNMDSSEHQLCDLNYMGYS